MKKHILISILISIIIIGLGLATNFIKWDETPLEFGIWAIPLGIGLLFEMPFLMIMGLLIGDATESVNYELWWSVIPLVSGIFYAMLYYFIVKYFKEIISTAI